MKLDDIQRLLSKIQGCTFAGLDCTTVVDLRGGMQNNMRGRVTKVTRGHRVMLFTNKNCSAYDNMVKRRLVAEGKDPGSFVLGPLKWGHRLPNSPIIEHKGTHYIQVIFLEAGEVSHFLDNEPIERHEITGYPPDPLPSAKQGLEREVIVRTYKLESIDAIRLMGEEIVELQLEVA